MKSKNFLPAVLALGILIGSCAQGDKTGTIGGKFSAPLFVQDKVLDAIPQNLSHFTVNADAGTQIHAADGAMILVPAGSFVDRKGKVVEGDVDLQYKSINTVAEIVASGLPMEVKYGDKTEQFISDGMFEISASQGGEPLEIASGKTLKVFTRGRDVESAFKYWYFDKLTGNWSELGDRTEMSNGEDIRSDITKMGIDLNSGITAYNWLWKKDRGNGIFSFAADPPVMVSPNVTIPGRYDKNRPVLDINFDKTSYPELQAYSRIMWQYAGNDPKEDPENNAWIYGNTWSDVELNHVKGSKDLFRLKFLVNQVAFTTIVRPVVAGKDLEKAEKLMKEQLAKYEAEKEKEKDRASQETIESNMYNAFSVRQMGVYNCDRFYADPLSTEFDMQFLFDNKMLDKNKRIYVLCDDKKNVISYTAEYYKFRLNPATVNAIFIVAANGTLAVAGAEALHTAEAKKGSKVTLVFNRLKSKIMNLASLDQAIEEL